MIYFAASLLIVVLHLLFHPIRVLGMDTSIFYMDEKYTLASFFTVVLTFMTGVSYLKSKKYFKKINLNLFLGTFFVALSMDEFFEIHEYVNTLVKQVLAGEGVLGQLSNLSWLFPLSGVILIVLIMFVVRILKEENLKTKKIMIYGTICYFFVLVFELVGSLTYGHDFYVYSVAVEEGLEMIGTALFLNASLLDS